MMSSVPHSRNPSSDSTSSNGSSYHFILEHILSNSSSYELPLRTMYTLNCAPRAQPPVPSASGTATPANGSPTSPSFAYQDQQAAAAQLNSHLMGHLASLPQQPCSLPPSFVTQFLHRCFPMELGLVEFPQALTALDYLKDLEMRRRKELRFALTHLGINEDVLHSASNSEQLAHWYPFVYDWVLTLDGKEKRAETLYTQLYIALRRWILINEMKLEPFNKQSCLAMLNTLYPPVVSSPPTSKLKESHLLQQREGFFQYIKAVEKIGPHILDPLILQGRQEGEDNGWAAVKRTLSNYLNLANRTIAECQDIARLEVPQSSTSFAETPAIPRPLSLEDKRGRSKTDSGVSFGTDTSKHSKNPSTSSNKSTSSSASKSTTVSDLGHRVSGLERLARELKKMKPRNRITVDEIIKPVPTPESPPKETKGRIIRKMRSLGAIGDLKHGNNSSSSLRTNGSSAVPAYNAEKMKRQREEYERRNNHV